MAKVTVPSINVGDEIKVDTFNDFITSANAVPGSINADNVMDEGIDRRNLATDSVQEANVASTVYYYPHGDADHYVRGGTGTSTTTLPAYFTLTNYTGGHPVMVGTPSTIECDNGDWIMVHCSFSFRADPSAFALVASSNKGGQEVHFRLIFDDIVAGTVLTEIGGTERRFNSFMVMDDSPGKMHAHLRHSCTIVAAFQAVTTSTGKNKIAVGLQARDMYSKDFTIDGHTIVSEIKLFARVIKR